MVTIGMALPVIPDDGTDVASTMSSRSAPPTAPADAATERPLRADAQRNRRHRVLDAAEELFVASGHGVRIEDVAAAAGVGVGTVCRNFPTKHDLLGAVLERMYVELTDEARAALAGADAVAAFRDDYACRMADLQAQRRVVTLAPGEPLPVADEVGAALRAAVDELVAAGPGGRRRASRRADAADVLLLFAGIAQVSTIAEHLEPGVRRRYATVLLDGLRPAGASPLPGRSLAPADLDAIRARRARRAVTPTAPGPVLSSVSRTARRAAHPPATTATGRTPSRGAWTARHRAGL